MINIQIPEVDYIVRLENVRDIPYNTSGVYIVYDKKGFPLYVGQASCLRGRIHAHFTGQGSNNTQRYAWAFYECKVFIEDDPASKNVYECYFINFLKPPLNKNINPNPYRGEQHEDEAAMLFLYPEGIDLFIAALNLYKQRILNPRKVEIK